MNSGQAELEVEKWSSLLREAIDEVSKIVLGKREELEVIVATIAAGGHVLIEGPPGAGKTLTSMAMARVIGGVYKRIQGNPDILPSDLTGFYVYSLGGERRFVKGPVFTNILQVDDLNRIPTRAQSALLQAMAEYKVSIEGETHSIERPFHVFASMIPPEIESGVFKVTIGLIDRFWTMINTGYAGEDVEEEIINRSDELYLANPYSIREILSPGLLIQLQDNLGKLIYADRRIVRYIRDIASSIRRHQDVVNGPSHRGVIYLYRVSKALALINGRDYVTPDDVKRLTGYMLPHRIITRAGGKDSRDIIKEVLNKVPVPKE
ncbi:MAG: MoxR family ATPase [Desulfurococcus sp.]|uniref:AAA family ATPase n=1 Tax=Desulfurococcus sp. TaxID=51678 RepID=UPI003165BF89